VSFVDAQVGRNPNRILSEVMLTLVDGHRPQRAES
jgi:hypothetical protein